MTKTQDELKAAVERLTADLTEPFGHFAGEAPESCALVRIEDARLILAALRSPDPEVERLRGALGLALSALDSVDVAFVKGGGHRKRLDALTKCDQARAALSNNSGGR